MKPNIKTLTIIILLALVTVLFVGFNLTGKIIVETDNFYNINGLHWTHMPLTYSITNCKNPETIERALSLISSQTNDSIYFEKSSNPDIEFTCSKLNDCYTNKTERVWFFWTLTTQVICEHESGTAQMTRIRGNKILNARINMVETGKEDNCSETIIHEILHVFNFQHSENNESIMYPEKITGKCNEIIDEDIVNELSKYRL